jgi:hypothetical protein
MMKMNKNMNPPAPNVAAFFFNTCLGGYDAVFFRRKKLCKDPIKNNKLNTNIEMTIPDILFTPFYLYVCTSIFNYEKRLYQEDCKKGFLNFCRIMYSKFYIQNFYY